MLEVRVTTAIHVTCALMWSATLVNAESTMAALKCGPKQQAMQALTFPASGDWKKMVSATASALTKARTTGTQSRDSTLMAETQHAMTALGFPSPCAWLPRVSKAVDTPSRKYQQKLNHCRAPPMFQHAADNHRGARGYRSAMLACPIQLTARCADGYTYRVADGGSSQRSCSKVTNEVLVDDADRILRCELNYNRGT